MLQEDFVGDRLVAFGTERIAGVKPRQIAGADEARRFDHFVQHGPTLFDRHNKRFGVQRLEKMQERRLRRGAGDDDASKSRPRRVSRGRDAVIAGRRNRNAARIDRSRRTGDAVVQPVLVAPGRIAALVLEQDRRARADPFRQPLRRDQRRPTFAERKPRHERGQESGPALEPGERRLRKDFARDPRVIVIDLERILHGLAAAFRAAAKQGRIKRIEALRIAEGTLSDRRRWRRVDPGSEPRRHDVGREIRQSEA